MEGNLNHFSERTLDRRGYRYHIQDAEVARLCRSWAEPEASLGGTVRSCNIGAVSAGQSGRRVSLSRETLKVMEGREGRVDYLEYDGGGHLFLGVRAPSGPLRLGGSPGLEVGCSSWNLTFVEDRNALLALPLWVQLHQLNKECLSIVDYPVGNDVGALQ